jgi:hypothetical protein
VRRLEPRMHVPALRGRISSAPAPRH